jgi:hypothetical protein
MKTFTHVLSIIALLLCSFTLLACECPCGKDKTTAPAPLATKTAPQPTTPSIAARPTIRINAGVDQPYKDPQGNTWAADSNFDGGTDVDRPDLAITGTNNPDIYHSERYSMDDYTFKLPNGKYLLRLHFSEDYDGIASPDERLFTYTVKDGTPSNGKVLKEVKDFSPWKAAGDHFKAYVDSIPVNLTSGQLSITFTPQVENPQINAIEIIPQ